MNNFIQPYNTEFRMYIQSVPLFVYFPLYPSRRWNKNEFTWILLWWILTEWHAVVTYILVCCEICWQRRLNTKKRKMQICNRNTNLMAETLNKITSTIRLKKGCTRQPSIFYLSVSTVSYNEAYHLTSLVEARLRHFDRTSAEYRCTLSLRFPTLFYQLLFQILVT